MNFLKNIFTIKRKYLTDTNMSHDKDNKDTSTITCDDNNQELTLNMHTRVINEITKSRIGLSLKNADKVIDPTDFDTFKNRVGENDKSSTICEYIPMNEVNNVVNELKPDSSCESDINTIYMESPKIFNEITNECSNNSLATEFDEVLSTLRKADRTHTFSKENISLNFVDEYFGKLNADLNTCNISHTHENINENQDSKLLHKTHKQILTNTDQKIYENADMNQKDQKSSITENKFIETIVRETEKRTSSKNYQDVFKEYIVLTSKKDSVGEHSFKELQTQGNCSKTHIDKIDKDVIEEVPTDKCENHSKTGDNINNNENRELNDDENDYTKLNKKCTETKLDTISINSTDDNDVIIDKLNDSYCSGYHSSDFEFITESEAELGGIITNGVSKEPHTFTNVPMTKDASFKRECGPSGSAPIVEQYNVSANTSRVRSEYINTRRNEIPQGDDYLNLFRGIYDPVLPLSHIYFLENKSVQITGMNVGFEGIGFDMRMMQRSKSESTDDEFKPEAIETRRKIISTYSRVNRKRHYPFRNKQK